MSVMRAIVASLAVVAVIAHARHADAGCRGGGGGGGSGGSGGGRGGGGGHGTEACADSSDVVGFRHCRGYGAWGTNPRVPHLTIEGGVIVRRFGSLLDHQTGTVAHGDEAFSYRVIDVGRTQRLDTAVLSTLRLDLDLGHALYVAAEADLGGLAQAAPAPTEMLSSGTLGTPELQQERGFVFDTAGVIGIHGATHAGGLGVELAGGVRAVSYSFHSRYVSCEQSTTITAVAPIGEARVRGELWLSPWLTAGVALGTSVIEQHTWMGGVYLGVHTRAFGGSR
jgi:hypothetical protein